MVGLSKENIYFYHTEDSRAHTYTSGLVCFSVLKSWLEIKETELDLRLNSIDQFSLWEACQAQLEP
jgi:hypothetical protein